MGGKSPQLDGQQQQEAYISALSTSATYFRGLLTTASSKSWKPIALPAASTANGSRTSAPMPAAATSAAAAAAAASRKGKEPAASSPLELDPANVVVHRRSDKRGEVYRATLEVPFVQDEDGRREFTTDGFRAVLATAEIRTLWDRMVNSAQTVEQLDADTRIVRTAYRLGWPSSPRDTITISKTFSDADAVINVSTSLPRSPDEPAYLRPAPPYVRADVSLLAFCVQLPQAQAPSNGDKASTSAQAAHPAKLKVTVFWQWNPKGTWAVGSSLGYHLPTLLVNLVEIARDYKTRVPLLTCYGRGVALGSTAFDVRHEALSLDWRVVPDDDGVKEPPDPASGAPSRQKSDDTVDRTLDFALPEGEGWRVQVTLRSTEGEDDGKPPLWSAFIGRFVPHPPTPPSDGSKLADPHSLQPTNLLLRVSHPPLADTTQSLRFKITITRDTASKAIRLNGVSQPVATIPLDSSHDAPFASADGKCLSRQLAGKDGEETASLSGLSLNTMETVSSVASSVGSEVEQLGGGRDVSADGRRAGERSEKAEKSVLSLVRRNYIYFTSLLQEPEAKWRPVLEAGKGVSVHQLDSIDRTLVVYRAEAVFVGVGIWDLLAAISTTGARPAWDKTHEDALLLEDVNELSELWWWKTKAAWPVAPRDSVHLRTTYKSPTSIHIFAFSTDDTSLFPAIPPTNPSIIRTQVDLLGWSIEALSPTTTQVTMLEQSDPKGWTNKSSIPQTMATTLSGIGDFAIRAGGPPMVTRLGYAKILSTKFDLEKNMLRVEYQSAEWRRSKIVSGALTEGASAPLTSLEEASLPAAKPRLTDPDHGPIPNVECELRCDTETWASSLDIVIDPPPQSVTCLRRHRLSAGGGGCWIIIEHDAVLVDKTPILLIVRKGPASTGTKDKHAVVVNGAKIKVDVEQLAEVEAKSLAKQKRTKPARIPLDQPPAVGGTRKVSNTPTTQALTTYQGGNDGPDPVRRALAATLGLTSPFLRAWLPASVGASQVLPPPAANTPVLPSPQPAQVALNALDSIRLLHTQWSDKEFWQHVATKDGLVIDKRVAPFVSTAHPIHRASKVLEGFSAEDVASVVSTPGTRRYWDDKSSVVTPLQSYGNGCSADFVTSRCAFPFRERGFYVASTLANITDSSPSTPTAGPLTTPTALYFVQSSFSPSVLPGFDRMKINPNDLPIGEMLVEGWVLENVDPYGNESLVIPSTRCTYFSSIDYAGSIPSAMNTSINSTLPTVILGVETFLQKRSAAPQIRFPSSGLNFEVRKEDYASPSSNGVVQMKEWHLDDVDDERVFLNDSFDPAESEYRSAYFVRLSSVDPAATPVPPSSKRLPIPDSWTADARGPQQVVTRATSNDSLKSTADAVVPLARHSSTASNAPAGRRIPHSASESSVRSSISQSSNATILAGSGTQSPPKRSSTDDLLVAEIIVDTTSFPAGYNVTTLVKLPPKAVVSGTPALPLKLDDLETYGGLPLQISVSSLPPSALHSASLSSTPPRRRHLVRLTLPTGRFSAPQVQDPLRGNQHEPPALPGWYRTLGATGLAVLVSLDPLAGQPYEDEGEVLVTVNGAVVIVSAAPSFTATSGGISSKHLKQDKSEAYDDVAGHWPRLTRSLVQPGDEPRSIDRAPPSIPPCLARPVAIATHLFPDPPPVPAVDMSQPSTAATPTNEMPPGAAADATAGGDLPTAASSATPTVSRRQSVAQNPLLTFFNRARTASLPPGLRAGQDKAGAGHDNGDGSGQQQSAGPSKLLNNLLASYSFDRIPRNRTFPLSTVVLVGLVAFLLGSLVRSLLTPADFVLYAAGNVKDAVVGAAGEGGQQQTVVVDEQWREIQRLVEWRGAWLGDDLLVAVVRRGAR